MSLVFLFALVSCERVEIRGTVLDVTGSPLPGVAVSAGDGEFQAVTNPLGQFALAAPPEVTTLSFMKTGFAPAEAALKGKTLAEPVRLWCLPEDAGLFAFESFRYHKLDPAEAQPYTLPDKKLVYGISKQDDVSKISGEYRLILFKVPAYDVRLALLESAEGSPTGGSPAPKPIWASGDTVPVEVTPIDEPERLIWEVRPLAPLLPGTYALHWGALDGHTSTDARLFLFEVPAPEPEDEDDAQ